MKKLKPCPFCGEYPEMSFEVIDEDINGRTYNCYTVMCVNEDCHLSVVTTKDNEDDAIEAWNRRKLRETESTKSAYGNGHLAGEMDQREFWIDKINERMAFLEKVASEPMDYEEWLRVESRRNELSKLIGLNYHDDISDQHDWERK